MFLIPLFFTSTAFSGAPTDFVKKRTDEILTILRRECEKGTPEAQAKRADLKQIIDALIDYDDLAMRSLGKHWDERTDDEKARYKELFRQLVEKNYSNKLVDQSVSTQFEIEYENEFQKQETKVWVVSSIIIYEDTETFVELHLRGKDDSYLVYDVVIDDVSLEKTYQENYSKIIEEDGFEELISRMEEKLKELDTEPDLTNP